ncbi:MAG: hypothetical protein HQK60_12970 [Deltaproteobacteria bacterium]|nr:hypothetical protein [Deltaproteobacteria bacterium]
MTHYLTWQERQMLQAARKQPSRAKRLSRLGGRSLALFGLLIGITTVIVGLPFETVQQPLETALAASFMTGRADARVSQAPKYPTPAKRFLTKQEVGTLLGTPSFPPGNEQNVSITASTGEKFVVNTTLDPDLQQYVHDLFEQYSPPYAAFVAMDPETGRIKAMVSYLQNGRDENLCIQSKYPAASLFKIITATAAIERKDYYPDDTIAYNGAAYQLDPRFLTKETNSYSHRISLRESFAKSINMVFGKLGVFSVGREILEEYAHRFYFNRPITFELPLEKSTAEVPADDYPLAKVASGYNRETSLSPIHGAMLAAAVANSGIMIEPTFIKKITDQSGNVVYYGRPTCLGRIMSPRTAAEMKVLMSATITQGTCASFFRQAVRTSNLCNVSLGGKTGTMFSSDGALKYNWFSGYGIDHDGKEIAISVLVINRASIRVKAKNVAGMALRHYFTHNKSLAARGSGHSVDRTM